MIFSRRTAIKSILASLSLPSIGSIENAFAQSNSNTSEWVSYEITTEISLDTPQGAAESWIPLPLVLDTDYFKTVSIKPETNFESKSISKIYQTPDRQARMLWTQWDNSSNTHSVKVITIISTRERHLDLDKPNPALKLSKIDRQFWTKGTALLPTNGIVLAKALEIINPLPKNANELQKAKAVYDWVVDNTHRDPKTRGCGVGDVKLMLETDNLGGKCADINAVYVALVRSIGIPARDVYGIRVADSERGYKSLGRSNDITKAQHCRAEFYANGYGWVPVDPADVRKVILEESGGLPVNDVKVVAIREYLWGNWEMNWMPYNYDHDIMLPGSKLGKSGVIGFLMYPQAEAQEGRFDSLDPENFKYKITSRKIG